LLSALLEEVEDLRYSGPPFIGRLHFVRKEFRSRELGFYRLD